MVLSFNKKKPSKRSEKKGEGFRQAGGPPTRTYDK